MARVGAVGAASSPGKSLKRSLSDSQTEDESSLGLIPTDASTDIASAVKVGLKQTAAIEVGEEAASLVADLAAALDEQRPTLHAQLQRGSRLLLSLLRSMGTALLSLGQYRCTRAVEELQALPPRHLATGWAQCLLGRAFYESTQYVRARQAFEAMRALAPARSEGLEIFSSVLWHLRLSNDLVHLAQSAMAFDRTAPQTWCVMANAASAQRDHARALVYLKRALQLDPLCVYAHSLRGHELVASSDLDGALEAFREAVRIDPRCYNAMYGIGTVFMRQQKFGAAEAHFHRACSIHPTSSPLATYLGLCLSASGKHQQALAELRRACALHRGNMQARFHLAQAHSALGDYAAARLELAAVHEASPREASVLVELGRVCKRLGAHDEAIGHLNAALELRPSAALASRVREMLVGGTASTDESEW
jgi:anaphase-promoting complex subunit 3